MTRTQQERLCALLNPDPRGVEWHPDPAAIGGGVYCSQNGREVARIVRHDRRIRMAVKWRGWGIWSTLSRETVGRGWLECAAGAIQSQTATNLLNGGE